MRCTIAKRFTDTDKWKKSWYQELKPQHKLFWIYILDNCNNAGVWDVNFKLAEYQIGGKLNTPEILEIFKKQYLPFNKTKWFIVDFIKFQFGCDIEDLKESNNAHLAAIKVIKEYNLLEKLLELRNLDKNEGLIEGLIELPKNKNKTGREEEQDKEKENVHELQTLIKSTKNISLLKTQLSFEQAINLSEQYSPEELSKVFRAMENHKELTKKNISVYLTAKNWIERDRKK